MSSNSILLYRPGVGNVGSYQTSGIPWVTSSLTVPASGSNPLEISFPQVTKSLIVKNASSGSVQIRVGFSNNGVINTSNYFLLSADESFAADLRITKLYLMSNNGTVATASVIAGLTGILCSELPNNWSGSAGVG